MSRRASRRGERAPAATPPTATAIVSPTAAAEPRLSRRVLAAGVALAVLIVAVVAFVAWPTATPVPPLSASTAPPVSGRWARNHRRHPRRRRNLQDLP
ncbi:MAG: hypothetical protein IPJ27_25075 [Candidatus Accumulibacter sp.]|uniref:Uncharacterized protein n=1 Tax=Candidatus Accumulibacter proximus TaxID=2954385 RepID=A0A935Q4A3_9PROT|nr:hypothetical protein [Candidatus Accumulibacter proximus]